MGIWKAVLVTTIAWIELEAGESAKQCETISIDLCTEGTGYNYTLFPNARGKKCNFLLFLPLHNGEIMAQNYHPTCLANKPFDENWLSLYLFFSSYTDKTG